MIIKNNGPKSFLLKSKEADIVISNDVKIGDFVIDSPGEYEIKGIFVEVIDGIYKIFAEDMNLVGIFNKNKLSNEELEKIENIDLLFISVGGLINTKNALEMINQIEPKIVIPIIHIDINEFNKLEGIKPEVRDILKIAKGSLSEEESRKIIVINEKSN